MGAFREYFEEMEQVDKLVNEFNTAQQAAQSITNHGVVQKTWSAKKPQILQMWKNLRSDVPILVTPISGGGEGSTYGEDGIRITGSWAFISAILARLKELAGYENPQIKLRLIFRGVDKAHARPDRQSFVFYFNLENRKRGKAGRPKITTPQVPQTSQI